MLKIGITGGIGSGKSVVCRLFANLGIPIYDADSQAKKLINTDTNIRQKLTTLLGEDLYNSAGIDRAKLAAFIFNNPRYLEQVNAIVHPAVALHFEQWLTLQHKQPYIIKEAAILFESGANKQVDKVIVIDAPLELRIQRVMQRDNIDRQTVMQRIQNQMPQADKLKRADFIIDTSLNIPPVEQVQQLHLNLLQIASQLF